MKAYAKINLFLNVLEKKDSLHEIKTIILPIDLYDEVIISYTKEEDIVICDTDCNTYNNLAYKALMLIKDKFNIDKTFEITIDKNIPSQAGLGGASSDAAVVLKLLNKMLKLKLTDEELIKLSSDLGSDVAFFIKQKPSFVTGTGDNIQLIPNKRKLQGIIIKPKFGFSTKEMYSKFTSYEENVDINKTISFLNKKGNELVTTNDFEKVIPLEAIDEINKIKQILTDNGATNVFMTGSGSSMIGLFKDCKKAFKEIKKYIDDYEDIIEFKTI